MNVYFLQDLFSDSRELKLIFGLVGIKINFRWEDIEKTLISKKFCDKSSR